MFLATRMPTDIIPKPFNNGEITEFELGFGLEFLLNFSWQVLWEGFERGLGLVGADRRRTVRPIGQLSDQR